MKKHLLLSFIYVFILFCPLILKAQNYTISGYVQDNKTGERLIDAGVFDKITGFGTYTNEYGFYSLSFKSDSANLKVHYIGYSSWERDIKIENNITLDIELEPNLILNEVNISAERTDNLSNPELYTLSPKDISSLPSFAGESDFMKVMQLLPGVSAGSEAGNDLFVRGGGDGQNLILLDGVPVYNIDHVYGFLSVFNSSAISHLNIYKGGFPVRYGGRLSSVIDVRMKEGNLNEYHGNINVGLVASSLTFEGPIKKGENSFMISARRTLIDIISKPFQDIARMMNGDEKLSLNYYFYDVNLKFNHIFSNKDRIFLSVYMGKDQLKSIQVTSFEKIYDMNMVNNWGNITSVLRWNHIYGNKLFSNISLYYSRFKSSDSYSEKYSEIESGILTDEILKKFESRVESITAKADWDWRINPVNNVRFGINYQNLFFNPGINTQKFLSGGGINESNESATKKLSIPKKFATDMYLYAEDNIKFKNLNINFGLHLSGYYVDNTFYPSLEPRINTSYRFSDKFSIHASYTEMSQSLHLLTKNTMILSSDLWMPSTANIKPMRAKQGVFGLKYDFNKNINVCIESYYKKMNNLIEYKDGTSYIEDQSDWENLVAVGSGNSYGIEFLVEKKSGRFTGWLSYTLSKTNRLFDELNKGREFPFKYDRRHNISIVGIFHINERINISANWVYYTGTAFTLTESTSPIIYPDITTDLNSIQHYSDKNAYRMPDYHRLDINVNFSKIKKNGTRTWSVGVYNIYNRKNPYYMYLDTNQNGESVLKQVSIFPLIPSVSYSYKF